jgi:hypothetical protein
MIGAWSLYSAHSGSGHRSNVATWSQKPGWGARWASPQSPRSEAAHRTKDAVEPDEELVLVG